MPFPNTPVLETFTGALAAPPNANWTRMGGVAAVDIQQDGSGFTKNNSSTTNNGNAYWNPTTYARPCEAYLQVVTLPNAVGNIDLELLIQNPTSATLRNGYELQWAWQTGAGNDVWKLQRWDNDVRTQLGSNLTGNDLAAGDSFGLALDATGVLQAWANTGGTWATVPLTFTDNTYTGSGNIGLVFTPLSTNTFKGDNFGGGTVVAAPVPVPNVVDFAVARAATY